MNSIEESIVGRIWRQQTKRFSSWQVRWRLALGNGRSLEGRRSTHKRIRLLPLDTVKHHIDRSRDHTSLLASRRISDGRRSSLDGVRFARVGDTVSENEAVLAVEERLSDAIEAEETISKEEVSVHVDKRGREDDRRTWTRGKAVLPKNSGWDVEGSKTLVKE
jgi:hypothetical protein